MKLRQPRILAIALLLCQAVVFGGVAAAQEPGSGRDKAAEKAYVAAIDKTSALVEDGTAQSLAAQYGLQIVNVAWEDTGRYANSSVGPNISDVTIQVQYPERPRDEMPTIGGETGLALMPVIRHPNFSDRTADISPDDFYLLVGNERGEPLRRVSLRDYLGDIREYLSDGDSWAGSAPSLLADRDSHVLVSAQAAFLPIPKSGKAEFNPVIFNYQSVAGDPAVLTIVATREGTSATIIDNQRDGFPAGWSWGQRLFFNDYGERASFTGQRQSEFAGATERTGVVAAGQGGLNMVLVIQVPLKQKNPAPPEPAFEEGMVYSAPSAAGADRSDVESAVIGHGKVEGPFTEIDGLEIERDDRFPVRVTVQFYKATSNGAVSAADMEEIAGQLEKVYADADYVGSLVVDGETGRPTEYDGSKFEPAGWWADFWQRFESDIGMTRIQAIALIRSLRMNAGRTLDEVDR